MNNNRNGGVTVDFNTPNNASSAQSALKNHYIQSWNHIAWANEQVIDALQKSGQPLQLAKPLSLLCHILSAEKVWLTRINGEDASNISIWPTYSLEECVHLAEQNKKGYQALFNRLSEADFAAVISYKNSQGTPFSTVLSDILTHVSLHGSYHRGQIASKLREAGFEPAATDYIIYIRQQQLE